MEMQIRNKSSLSVNMLAVGRMNGEHDPVTWSPYYTSLVWKKIDK